MSVLSVLGVLLGVLGVLLGVLEVEGIREQRVGEKSVGALEHSQSGALSYRSLKSYPTHADLRSGCRQHQRG